MRNYLFDRSGPPAEGGLPPVRRAVYTPARGPLVRPVPRRRRGPWIVAFLVLILSLTAAGVILQIFGDQLRWSVSFGKLAPFGGGNDGAPYEDFDAGPFGDGGREDLDTTIPRASVGDGTVLTIAPAGESVLTASQIYEQALPSVVSVAAYSELGVSTGSGIVMSADGYIITNYHIIEGCSEAWVSTLVDGGAYEALLVGYAADLDIAVLKVDAQDLTPARFGSSRSLKVGENVYALGNPLGYLYGSFTEGIVSALGRNINVGGYDMTLIQTSAALNSGNSGGALLNTAGQVVGITSAKVASDTDVVAEGLGLAIPISDVRGCINSILACGEVITPRIGIMAYSAEAGGVKGVAVKSVEEDGPAGAAGLRPDDLITAANGIPVSSVEELKDVFYDTGVGGVVELTVLRDGAELLLSMELTADDGA